MVNNNVCFVVIEYLSRFPFGCLLDSFNGFLHEKGTTERGFDPKGIEFGGTPWKGKGKCKLGALLRST